MYIMCVMLVQRFEPQDRRFTYFHYYYYRKLSALPNTLVGLTVNVSSVQMLFEEERFQIGFEGGKTWNITQRFGEGSPRRWSEKARFPYLLNLMRGTVTRPASAEHKQRDG